MRYFADSRLARHLTGSFYIFSCFAFGMQSCTPSSLPKPPVSDSVYLIDNFSIYQGGDSTYVTAMSRNTYTYDSVSRQLLQLVYDSTAGSPGTSGNIIYQYGQDNKLQSVKFNTTAYVYQSVEFQYSTMGDLEKAIYTGFDGSTVENEFTTRFESGNKVVTQYDTLSSNIGKGAYYSSRPCIIQYVFNAKSKLIAQYLIGSELFDGKPAYGDTVENSFEYDGQDHLSKLVNHYASRDGGDNITNSSDTMLFTRDNSEYTPVDDLANATLRNLSWLASTDYVGIFANPTNSQYTYTIREEPLQTTFDAFATVNYTANYQNTFDSLGLLTKSSIVITEHNIYNQGNTKHETHYYHYVKIKR